VYLWDSTAVVVAEVLKLITASLLVLAEVRTAGNGRWTVYDI